MTKLIAKEKEIVTPGDMIASGMDYVAGSNTYRDKEDIIASRLGVFNVDGRTIKVIPLSGKYVPKRNDVIIGQVIDISFSGWRIDTNSAYSAMLNIKDATSEFINKGADLTQFFEIGDYAVAKIVNVTSQKLIDLTLKGPGLRNLKGGRIISVNPHKVPRIIGKSGSMVEMIKEASGCRITVGQNGLIWLDGEPENEIIAVNAIKKIEEEAHISGLTDKMKDYLEKVSGKKITEKKSYDNEGE